MGRMTKLNKPYIWPIGPFIGSKQPVSMPFVAINMPSVGMKILFGFTMVELMVTLAIAGILVTVTAPSISRFIESSRLTTVTNEFILAINTGRADGIKRGFPVILCESASGTGCDASGSWNSANGWILFTDIDSSGGWSANDTMLQVHSALPSSLKIASTTNTITFNRLGAVGAGSGTYTVCNTKINQTRAITLAAVGQTSIRENDPCP